LRANNIISTILNLTVRNANLAVRKTSSIVQDAIDVDLKFVFLFVISTSTQAIIPIGFQYILKIIHYEF